METDEDICFIGTGGNMILVAGYSLLFLCYFSGLRQMEKNSPVEYEPMGNGPEPAEIIQTSTADQTETAMLPRDLTQEPISFIALNQSQNDNFT